MQFSVPLSTPNSVPINQVTEAIGNLATFVEDVTVPPSATAFQLYAGEVSGGSLALQAEVIGLQSEVNYSDGFENVPNGGLTVAINPAIDSGYQITWHNPGLAGTWILTVAARLSTVGSGPANITVTCDCSGGGGGGMLAAGFYQSLDPSGPTWTAEFEVGATLLQGDNLTFDLPANCIAIVTADATVESEDSINPFLYGLYIGGLTGGDVGFETRGSPTDELPGSFTVLVDSTVDSSFALGIDGGSINFAFAVGPTVSISCFARP
jgi:hypothetical protein